MTEQPTFDLLSPGFRADPYPYYARMRREAPVFKTKINYDPKSLVPVAKIGSQPVVMVVRKDLPASNLKEFVELAKKRSNTEPLTFGSPVFGSPHQVFFEQMQRDLGVKMVHVPFRGIAPAVTEVLSGRIDMTFATENSAAGLVADNKVKALAVLGPARVKMLPQLQTSAEAGYPKLRAGFWYALVAPPHTPKAIVDRYNALVEEPDFARLDFSRRWLLRLCLWTLPLPWVSAELGWFVAEYGRQPWAIDGVLPTFLGSSSVSAAQVLFTLSGFVLFYSVLLVIDVVLMRKYVRMGPVEALGPPDYAPARLAVAS